MKSLLTENSVKLHPFPARTLHKRSRRIGYSLSAEGIFLVENAVTLADCRRFPDTIS